MGHYAHGSLQTYRFLIFFSVSAVWSEPISLINRLVVLGISDFISWAFIYIALQFWKK
jgi:hypothetical protein